jgi:hypothetical protein
MYIFLYFSLDYVFDRHRACSADIGTTYLGLFPLTQHYSIYQPSTIESARRTGSYLDLTVNTNYNKLR